MPETILCSGRRAGLTGTVGCRLAEELGGSGGLEGLEGGGGLNEPVNEDDRSVVEVRSLGRSDCDPPDDAEDASDVPGPS